MCYGDFRSSVIEGTKTIVITIARNRMHALHMVRLSGELTPDQFFAAFAAIAREPEWARADTFYVVEANVRLAHADAIALLNQLQELNRRVFEPLDVYLVRRAVWICYAPAAWPLIEHWLKDRHSRDGLQSEFCAGATLDVARQLFDETEVAAVAAGRNFETLAAFL